MGKCKFNEDWLKKKDKNGHIVCEWGKKEDSDTGFFCFVCLKKFSIAWGFEAIEQHVSTQKHKEQCKVKLTASQLHMTSLRPNEKPIEEQPSTSKPENSQRSCVQLYSVKDGATRAEILWAMKMVVSDFPIEPSCDSIKELFSAMFPNSLPSDFSMSTTKARYLICDAIAPYFRQEMMKDYKDSYFSLCFDETCNAASKKELQVAIKYWSPIKEMIITTHLETFFIGKATAEDIYSKLNEAMDNAQLSRKRLLMLGCDGPNVNKAVTRLMNDSLILLGRRKLADIGTCNIHTVHNAFLKALMEFGESVSDFIFQIHNFFDGWPARWEEYEIIQDKLNLPNHRFIKHVSSRWLTMGPAAERVLEQWPAIIEYFTKHLPKKQTNTSQNFKNIYNFINQKLAKAEIMFVVSSVKMFVKVTGFFQREEPLVHMIHEELKKLVRTIFNRFCVKSAPTSVEGLNEKYYVPLQDIVLEDSIRELLETAQERDRVTFLHKVKNHYVAACKHLLTKTSMDYSLIKYLAILNPKKQNSETCHKDFLKIANTLPVAFEETALTNECLLLMQHQKGNQEEQRIETYWGNIFKRTFDNGEKMFPNLEHIVKAALALSHGNADVERGFSCSGRILTPERANMCQRTLDAHLTVKSALKNMYENKIHLVPLTPELMKLARTAYIRYKTYCEEQKQKEEIKKLEKKRNEELDREKKELKRKYEETKTIIEEGETTLKKIREEEKIKRETIDR